MANCFLSKSKNRFITLSVASLSAFTFLAPVASISAAVPAQQKTQAPGFYRMALGDFEVTALYDGYINIDNKKLLKNIKETDLQKLLSRMFIASTNVQTAVNAYLVNTGTNLVLVDVGSAKCFGPTAGFIQDNIKVSGYEPSQIDTIVITHLHPDHACGLVNAEGKRAFPNAEVRVAKAESDYWLDPKVEEKAPAEFKPFFKMVRDAIQPYKDAGKFKPFAPNEALVPGLVAIPTPGHTPGHTSYEFRSKNETFLVLGDIIHSHAVQFPRPQVGIQFDTDSKKAISIRSSLFANAAKNKTWLAGAHLPFPGIGHIRPEGKGYVWVPLEYSPFGTNL
jgi:glyoxylase-like metal-dependent hydrolase (beta-lactamase superfamily II)